jgi:hypothetical protein
MYVYIYIYIYIYIYYVGMYVQMLTHRRDEHTNTYTHNARSPRRTHVQDAILITLCRYAVRGAREFPVATASVPRMRPPCMWARRIPIVCNELR